MMSELHFQLADESHLSLVAQLVNSAYRGDSSRQGWTTEADLLGGQRTDPQAIRDIITAPDNVIILCLQAGDAIGTVHLRREQTSCHFGMFTVRPALQGRGIGKQFIAYAEQFARDEWGCTTMSMTVIELREELLQWYARRGYQNTGLHVDFPYGDARFGLPRHDDLQLVILRKSLLE